MRGFEYLLRPRLLWLTRSLGMQRAHAVPILINALPFDRELKGADSLDVCGQLLANPGNILVLFPEGTRTTTGQMSRFRSGIGRLVAGTELPVVPFHLWGGVEAFPKGALLPRPMRLRLSIGEPRRYPQPSSPEAVREICEDLHRCVSDLGGVRA